jgi:hypothetical protein
MLLFDKTIAVSFCLSLHEHEDDDDDQYHSDNP